MLKHKAKFRDLELPSLPLESRSKRTTDSGIIYQDQFTRKNLKSVLHLITQELKKRGTKTPHIFLPFRSKIKDFKLNELLLQLMPQGKLIQDVTKCKQICLATDEFTLMCCLKYFGRGYQIVKLSDMKYIVSLKRKRRSKIIPRTHF